MKLRLIGDIHSNRKKYLSLINGAEYSLQVGDLDIFGFDWLATEGVDSEKHKFIGGNHDNYNKIDVPHNLGDFGTWSVPDFGDIFFVRGAWSIDQKWRNVGIDWWAEEEMSYARCQEAIQLFAEIKPSILVSHACPTNIIQHVTHPEGARRFGHEKAIMETKTDNMLQSMLCYHKPKLHVFGHYHKKFDGLVDGLSGSPVDKDWTQSAISCGEWRRKNYELGYTRYVCLPEFGTLELDASDLVNL